MSDLSALCRLSAKLDQNLDLVQAGGGNTSWKQDGTLWVKASGKWLARALEEDMFLPVPLATILRSMDENRELTEEHTTASGVSLRPSVETSMHAVLPHKVVVHVHSVRTISWAIRTDAPHCLTRLLDGLHWVWVPYVHPGLVLGREIRARLDSQPDVVILGNHGLIVGADDFDSVETLLQDVERRLNCPVRPSPVADVDSLGRMDAAGFRIAPDPEVHALAMDSYSLKIAALGTLYPDQCVYLGPAVAILDEILPVETVVARFLECHQVLPKVLLVPDRGVLVANDLSRAGREVLISVKRLLERLDPAAPVRALDNAEVSKLINWEAEKYRIAQATHYEAR